MYNHSCRVGMMTHRIALGEHHLRLSAEEEICASMSVLASCVSTNEKSSFYSTHLQVRFTIVSENRSAAISMHGRHLSFYRNT